MEAIVAFLTARLDEDEARARGVRVQKFGPSDPPSPFEGMTLTFVDDRVLYRDMDVTNVYDEWLKSLPLADSSTATLADIAAKRAIVALHSTPDGRDPSCSSIVYAEVAEDCETLRAMVQPYAEHPDFDPAWRVA